MLKGWKRASSALEDATSGGRQLTESLSAPAVSSKRPS